MADITITGADKFARVSKDLKNAGDKELRKELYRGINRAVKPLTKSVKDSTTDYLPRRYAVELSKSLRIRASRRTGKNPGIRLIAKAKTPGGKDRDLVSLNRGRLRHPLYGSRKHWYDQKVSPNFWDDPLLKGVSDARKEIVKTLDDVAKKLARKY